MASASREATQLLATPTSEQPLRPVGVSQNAADESSECALTTPETGGVSSLLSGIGASLKEKLRDIKLRNVPLISDPSPAVIAANAINEEDSSHVSNNVEGENI
ncbi:unnamed protein product [Protopolystoma xenopodis]|uniref:Uncharacterized protein n=1 Tax=Protopolystoma xenopodis TaxID=117903 RepID=A0A448XGF0_9PLAT|nr:unnamed protein product [Protopolystoma xenopodis]